LAPAEGSRVRGRATSRPAPRVMGRRHREDGTRLAPRERGADDGASPQPDPLGHLSSRNRGSTGWRADATRRRPTPMRRWTRRLRRSHRTSPSLPRKREELLARGPLRGPACARLAAGHGAGTPLARSAHAEPGTSEAGPLAQSRRPPGAEGRFTRCSAKSIRIRRHPRCLPSTSCPVRATPAFARGARTCAACARLSPCGPRRAGFLPRLLPACGEYTALRTTIHLSGCLDGLPVVKARSSCGCEGPKPLVATHSSDVPV
jgi:hypothetical protein